MQYQPPRKLSYSECHCASQVLRAPTCLTSGGTAHSLTDFQAGHSGKNPPFLLRIQSNSLRGVLCPVCVCGVCVKGWPRQMFTYLFQQLQASGSQVTQNAVSPTIAVVALTSDFMHCGCESAATSCLSLAFYKPCDSVVALLCLHLP